MRFAHEEEGEREGGRGFVVFWGRLLRGGWMRGGGIGGSVWLGGMKLYLLWYRQLVTYGMALSTPLQVLFCAKSCTGKESCGLKVCIYTRRDKEGEGENTDRTR